LDDSVLLNLLVEFADVEERMLAAEFAQEHRLSRGRDLSDLAAEYAEEAAEAVRNDQSANAQLKGKELEIKGVEAALARKSEQIVGIIDRRQLRGLKDEMSALEKRLGVMENEAMALLIAVEEAEADRRESASDSGRVAQRGQTELAKLDQPADRADSVLPHLQIELDRLLSMMPEATKRHLMRLRKNGETAVARVESGVCGGCFSRLTPQQGAAAEGGRGLVKCTSCARFVVHHQWC